ncbi:group II intron maturase-specific domain-containing protein, partial [Globicatella sanguinis]
ARGWIQYHGRGYIKGTIRAIESWLHRRIRQLILKRWKRPRTKIKELMKRGLTLDESKRIAYSRKKYWRLSRTWEVHQAIPTEKLYQWGILNMTQLAEKVYLHY